MKKLTLLVLAFLPSALLAGEGALAFDVTACSSYTLTIDFNENGGTAPRATKYQDGKLSYKTITFQGTPVWSSGFNGSAITCFDPNYIKIALSNDSFFNFQTGARPWTIKILCKTTTASGAQKYVAWIGADAGGQVIAPQINAAGNFIMANSGVAITGVPVPSNKWVYLVGTYNGSILSLYVFYDGKLQGFENVAVAYNLTMNSFTYATIGSAYVTAGVFPGQIDGFQLTKEWMPRGKIEGEYSKLIKKGLQWEE